MLSGLLQSILLNCGHWIYCYSYYSVHRQVICNVINMVIFFFDEETQC